MFFTSRENEYIQRQLHNHIQIDIRARKEDIQSYVNALINEDTFKLAKEIRKKDGLATQIVDNLVGKAQGMYVINLALILY